MGSYIADELPRLIGAHFPADMHAQGITGHSMGGHGALTLGAHPPRPLPQRVGVRADRRADAVPVGRKGADRLSRRRPRGMA
jgi:S-formylglutathione hydrolase